MVKYEIRALVGTNGMGTIINEVVNGTWNDCVKRLQELNKEYGGFYRYSIYEDGLQTFDSDWK